MKDIEKFYQNPETHEELVENMKILREIPEDTSDPKVVIKLGDLHESHKFVFMEDDDGRSYIIALPIDKKSMHVDIANFARKLYKKDMKALGGGYMHTEGDKLVIDGSSGSYGEAPKEMVKEILQKKFPDMEIESKSLDDDRKQEREKRYKAMLDRLETTVQKELYANVCDQQAIKLRSDYTSVPQTIEGNEDMAYMIYSSELGNFGFDTLYIGYKDKNGEIKSKGILRERWYINIDDIKIENNEIVIKYTVENKESTITIPLDEIEQFDMISTLTEDDEKLLNTFKETQVAYQDNEIAHGVR